MNDLEIIDSDAKAQVLSPTLTQNLSDSPQSAPKGDLTHNSAVLNELTKENDELQNKIKLQYRRLLLFETENNRLLEEKNKHYFDAQNHIQKNDLLLEKNSFLEAQNEELEKKIRFNTEKISSLEKINLTQLSEIRRFAKFHTKIQNTVKPFILQLKNRILELTTELNQTRKLNENLTGSFREFGKKTEIDLLKKNNEITNLKNEKLSLTQTYEEQIHSFSKEIVELQSKNEDANKEIVRLKKAVEFKNYFENELIRFKRTHDEDQSTIQSLTQKKSALEGNVLKLEEELINNRNIAETYKNSLEEIQISLDVTRNQLAKKIDEVGILNDRLTRLEKLNNQLSREMTQNS